MRIASLLDIPEIIGILRESFTSSDLEGMEFVISMKMRVPGTTYFLSENNDALVLLEPCGSAAKAQYHIYTKESARGKGAIAFAKEVAEAILRKTEYQCFIGFTPADNRPAKVFARLMGFKTVGELEFDNGTKENITMTTRETWQQGRNI